jgi:hypothetical protein
MCARASVQVDMDKLFGPDATALMSSLNTEGQHRGYVAQAKAAEREANPHNHSEHADDIMKDGHHHHGHEHEHGHDHHDHDGTHHHEHGHGHDHHHHNHDGENRSIDRTTAERRCEASRTVSSPTASVAIVTSFDSYLQRRATVRDGQIFSTNVHCNHFYAVLV